MLELTPLNEIKYTYYEPGYWVIHNPFKSGVDEYVKWCNKRNKSNIKKQAHNNPFQVNITEETEDTQNVAFNLLKPFYKQIVGQSKRPYVEDIGLGWLNLYEADKLKCRGTAGLPHNDCCDCVEGIVANYFMCDNVEESSTRFYKFHGDLVKEPRGDWNLFYDFTLKDHPLYSDYMKLYKGIVTNNFPNLSKETLEHFKYEYEGEAPSLPWKLTIYEFKRSHTAYIPNSVKYRFSSCFLYGQIPHPWFRDL